MRDYGLARIGGFVNYNGDWASFIQDADPWVSLIAILSGPADSNMPKNQVPPQGVHRDTESGMVTIWHRYLDKGFHLSPVADQDNHRKTWGTRTAARTGVWLDKPLTRTNLLQALKEGRCYASEDKNLEIWFSISNRPMGSVLADPGSTNLTVEFTLLDPDESGSAYRVDLYREVIADGKLPEPALRDIALTSPQSYTGQIAHTAGTHECFFLRVKQWPFSTRDDAWTAPIWIDPALVPESPEHTDPLPVEEGTRFVGAKGSKVYHLPECSVVRKQIKPKNLVQYTAVPTGKKLHDNCPAD